MLMEGKAGESRAEHYNILTIYLDIRNSIIYFISSNTSNVRMAALKGKKLVFLDVQRVIK